MRLLKSAEQQKTMVHRRVPHHGRRTSYGEHEIRGGGPGVSSNQVPLTSMYVPRHKDGGAVSNHSRSNVCG